MTMGHVNVIWQGDANALALRALRYVTTPTSPINVSGPEKVSSAGWRRNSVNGWGGCRKSSGTEAPTAWLTNTDRARNLFGYPIVPIETMINWVADWIMRDMPSLGKPTHFEVRDGSY